jgi:hypothetical protein
MESRLLERRLLFTMLGAISSSCRVSLLRYIRLYLFANAYLDYQVSLVLILPSVKLTKYLVFAHKTIHVTFLVEKQRSSNSISSLGLGPGASLRHLLCFDPSVPWVFLDVHTVSYPSPFQLSCHKLSRQTAGRVHESTRNLRVRPECSRRKKMLSLL